MTYVLVGLYGNANGQIEFSTLPRGVQQLYEFNVVFINVWQLNSFLYFATSDLVFDSSHQAVRKSWFYRLGPATIAQSGKSRHYSGSEDALS